MVDPSNPGYQPKLKFTKEELLQELKVPTDRRIFAIAQAMYEKTLSVQEIHDITKIDHWFLSRLEHIVQTRNRMEEVTFDSLDADLMFDAKKVGFSDSQIAKIFSCSEND